MRENQKGIVFILIAAVLYSLMPVLARILNAGGMPPMSQVFLRYIFAFSAALIYFKVSKSKLELKKPGLGFLVIMSVFGYALANLFYTYGVLNTLASNALFIFFSSSIIAPVAAYFFLKEKLNRFNIIGLVISFLALFLLFQPNSMSTWKIGGFFALLASLGQVVFVILRRKLKGYSSQQILLSSTFFGVTTVGLLALVFENWFYVSPDGFRAISQSLWWLTIIFGLFNFSAWFFMTKGFQLLKAATGSLVLLAENVFVVFFAYMFLNEIPTVYSMLGGALIVVSAGLVALKGDNS